VGQHVADCQSDREFYEAKARPQARLLDIENQLATNKFEQFFAPHYDYIYFFSIEFKKKMKIWVGNRFI